MSVFNVDPYIDMAVRSILAQTFTDFEFLIIDDASKDGTWAQLEALARRDKRIRLWRNDTNEGVASCINYLAAYADGGYIARMDGDDISVPDRFEKQIEVLESRSADLCGGWMLNFDEYGGEIFTYPGCNAAIRATLLFQTSFSNPTVMMHESILQMVPLRSESVPAADYDFFVRIPERKKMYNLPVILLYRRVHAGQISERKAKEQVAARANAAAIALAKKGIYPTIDELRLHNLIYVSDVPKSWNDVVATGKWFDKLHTALLFQPSAHELLVRLWYRYCLKATRFGFKTYSLFRKSNLQGTGKKSFRKGVIIFVLSVFRIKHQSKAYKFLFLLTNDGKNWQKITREAILNKTKLVEKLEESKLMQAELKSD